MIINGLTVKNKIKTYNKTKKYNKIKYNKISIRGE